MGNNTTLIIGLLAVALLVSAMGTLSAVTKWSITGLQTIGTTNATVNATADITLTTSSVNFGSVAIGIAAETSDGGTLPFVVQNDGSVNIDVAVGSTQLWDGAASTSAYYRVKCRDGTIPCGSGSETTYKNMPIGSAIQIIGTLGFTNGADDNKVDIEITAPNREPQGAASASVTFTASAT
jgi:uncharacterized cupredoxin-like copper-binding protein